MKTLKQELHLMLVDQRSRLNVIRYFAFQGFAYFAILITALLFGVFGSFFLFFTLVLYFLLGIVVVLMIILNIIWTIRRLHDVNFSGYWILTPFIFLLPALASTMLPLSDSSIIKMVLVFSFLFLTAIAYFMLLILMFIPGTKGVNKYGDVPPNNNFFTYIFLVIFIFIFSLMVIAEILKPDENGDQSDMINSARKVVSLNLR